ncbi:tRNA uridine-5-carboxymethylaminomethyl(34) synthesis GTPase MnmE [Mesorhizobium sp. A556]
MIFTDTIVALSSGRLPAGVAVVRISGSQSRFVAETISGPIPPPRQASYRTLRNGDGGVLDRGLVLFFPGPGSFTGEDSAEFHVHGSRAVVAALLDCLVSFPGVRHAEPGEFTRRAFLNGKLDLTETEALADLLNAETEAQRRFAMLNASGAQSELYGAWRKRLIHARAMVEADIDFADEEDVPGSVADSVWRDVDALQSEMETHIEGFHAAEIMRDGYDVVIVGAPNAGKSSLLNALARRDAAIVTEEAGTTRDLIEVALDIGGLRVRVTDTAGIRAGAGSVEAIGIERARERAHSADLVLVLLDINAPVPVDLDFGGIATLRIGTKSDLVARPAAEQFDLAVSTRDGQGLGELLAKIGARAAEAVGSAGDVLPSRARHVELLRETVCYMQEAVHSTDLAPELRCESLRLAGHTLGRIVGTVDVEDLLDVIFSQFCIGK